MAVLLSRKDSTIEVIARVDTMIGEIDEDAYSEYLKTLDEAKLDLQGEPTRFVLRKILPFRLAEQVKNKQVDTSDGKAKFQYGYQLEEVRCSLIDIKNPSELPKDQHLNYKADNDGGAERELIGLLDSAGIVGNLFIARTNQVGEVSESIRKKSRPSSKSVSRTAKL